jgi:hypothetical protein
VAAEWAAWQPAKRDHGSAAAWAALGRRFWSWVVVLLDGGIRWGSVQKLPAERQLCSTVAVGQEAVMADAVEAVGQGVEQEAADELISIEGHKLRFAVMAIVLPTESDLGVGHADQAGIGDGDTMR